MSSLSTQHVVPAALDAEGNPLTAPADLAEDVIQLVRRWLTEAADYPVDAAAARLAGLLKDPKGLDFAVGFVDEVIRPEDLRVAAINLKKLAPKVPGFLPWYMRRPWALAEPWPLCFRRSSCLLPARFCAKWWGT